MAGRHRPHSILEVFPIDHSIPPTQIRRLTAGFGSTARVVAIGDKSPSDGIRSALAFNSELAEHDSITTARLAAKHLKDNDE
jgi:hypothetical protein